MMKSVRVRAAVWRAPRPRSVGPVARAVVAPTGCSCVPDVNPPATAGSGVPTRHVDVVRTEVALVTRGAPVRPMFAELIPDPLYYALEETFGVPAPMSSC